MNQQSNRKHSFRPARYIERAFLCLLLFAQAQLSFADTTKIAILVPETSSKAKVIYDEIMTGVRTAKDIEFAQRSFTAETSEQDIRNWLTELKPAAVIAVGKVAYDTVKKTKIQLPLVGGGFSVTPASASGVSLAGEPEEFFRNVKEIAPSVERVHLIYNERINGWWVKNAYEKAAQHGLELVTFEAGDVKSGAKLYKKVLKNAKREKDAVWIPLVSAVPSKTVLPMVLRKAWDKHLVVFTNSPSHARQGALFSLYPDNAALGEQLINLALDQLERGEAAPKVVLAKNMKRAFNWRTASHLGLEYSLEEGSGFDRIYPVQ